MSRPVPVRTCVGCRVKAAKSELVRLVVDVGGPSRAVVVDERGTRPGRGAHLHPSLSCLEVAERRRAFPRAFRLEGPLDTTALHRWFETNRPVSAETAPPDNSRKRSSGS
jgi:predicted RNA-binding protein YlxR (DUF448 family)